MTYALSFTGYDCCTEFCKRLFDKNTKISTIMAHNGAGYDNRCVVQWCIKHGLTPAMTIRQGSLSTAMHLKPCNIRFIDTLHFFHEGLRHLPAIVGITDTVKGYVPLHLNMPETQTI